jgi:hypothetical protein
VVRIGSSVSSNVVHLEGFARFNPMCETCSMEGALPASNKCMQVEEVPIDRFVGPNVGMGPTAEKWWDGGVIQRLPQTESEVELRTLSKEWFLRLEEDERRHSNWTEIRQQYLR